MEMTLRTAFTRDGAITALDFTSRLDGGAYGSFGVVTLIYSGQLLTGPYRIPAFAFDGVRVFTNKPPCGAQRGHGAVQPRFAFEVHLDRIAEDLGIDPLEIRRLNAVEPGDRTVNEYQITSCGFRECLDRAADAIGWSEKHGRLPRGRGVGLAGGFYVSGAANP
jgi:4-hydroxybenzoyl-CoA reductase subunit alpha